MDALSRPDSLLLDAHFRADVANCAPLVPRPNPTTAELVLVSTKGCGSVKDQAALLQELYVSAQNFISR